MGTNAASDRLTVEQLTESDVDAIRVAIRTALLNVHTALPGIVKAFDKTSQTATVQPALQSEYVDLGVMTLPLIPKVPVLFLGGGGYVQTFPVAEGDECLLVFSERAIDGWFQNGGVSPPSDDRVHDLTDGFAIVGFRSMANALQDFEDGGAAFLVPDGGTLYLGGKGTPGPTGARPMLIGDVDAGPSDPLIAWMTAVGSFTGAGPPTSDMFSTKVKAR